MPSIVAIGEVLIDFLEQGNSERGNPVLEAQPGGAPANFLAAAARLGVGAALIAKVGEDAFGRSLLTALKKQGIETRGVVADGSVFTTLAFVTLDGGGDRTFSFARKPGADVRLRWEEVDPTLIDGADALHFGTLSLTHEPARSATRRAVEYARGRGKLITFDPNLREPLWDDLSQAQEQILWGLGQADVVKLSQEEAEFALNRGGEEAARWLVDELGCQTVFVTMGGDGCVWANPLGMGRVPAAPVNPVDTTGAGDAFGGTAVARLLLAGKPPAQLSPEELAAAARYACAAAGLSTQAYGGLGSAPAPEEVAALLARW